MGGGFLDTSQFDSPSDNKKDSVSLKTPFSYIIIHQLINRTFNIVNFECQSEAL
jgi:hypothetical protein